MVASTTQPPEKSTHRGINRREFLYYLGGAGLILLGAEACAAITSYALPHQRPGIDFFQFGPDQIPAVGTSTRYNPFYLSNTDNGLFALSLICSQHDCYLKWISTDHLFICPCCGGHFDGEGVFLGNSFACQDLTQFAIKANTPNGLISTPSDGGPVDIQDATDITVYIHQKIVGQRRTDLADCVRRF